MKVAFVGIGAMGKPMAANIARGGHELSVFDSDSARTATVAEEIGARYLRQRSELGAAEVIITMLPDAHAVREVALGDGGIAAVCAPGAILVDMSSSQPLVTRETGAALAAKSITLIDAPVSGGVERATKGTLTIMLGGDDPAALRKVHPLLECLGNTFFEVGGLGAGHAAKALNNVVAASNYAVLAEAMLVAERYGVAPKQLVDIISTATGQSFISTVVMKQFVVPETWNSGFKIGLLAKDAAIAGELSARLGCDAPLIQLTLERWAQARDALGPAEDHSRAITVWRQE